MIYSYVKSDAQATLISVTDNETLRTKPVGKMSKLHYISPGNGSQAYTHEMALTAISRLSDDDDASSPLKGLFREARNDAAFKRNLALKAELLETSIRESLNNPQAIQEEVDKYPKSATPAYTITEHASVPASDSNVFGFALSVKVNTINAFDSKSGVGYEIGYNCGGNIIPLVRVFADPDQVPHFDRTVLNTLHHLNRLEDLGPEAAMKKILGKAAGKDDPKPGQA